MSLRLTGHIGTVNVNESARDAHYVGRQRFISVCLINNGGADYEIHSMDYAGDQTIMYCTADDIRDLITYLQYALIVGGDANAND